MTTTHYLAIGFAILLVGGVVLYNFIQERRFRNQADRMFSNRRGDILLGDVELPASTSDDRLEPSFQRTDEDILDDLESTSALREDALLHAEATGAFVQSIESLPAMEEAFRRSPSPVQEATSEFPEAVVQAEAPAEQAVSPARSAHRPISASPLDPEIEFVARLRFAHPSRLTYPHLLEVLRRLGKPIRAFGLREDGVWEALGPYPAVAYDAVEWGMLLADRNGPVSAVMLDAFCNALYEFAAEHGGAVSCTDRQDALDLAQNLDQFCAGVDVMIGLNVVSPSHQPMTGEDVFETVKAAGLDLGVDGAFVLRDGQGRTLFSVTNQEETPFPAQGSGLSTHGVTLLFDVPRVDNGLAVFDRMTNLGFGLAERLGARLVDDNGHQVSQDSLNKDRALLANFYGRMQDRGIPAGSERALRLFA